MRGFNDVHQQVWLSNKPLGSQVMSQTTDNYNDLPNTGETGEQKQ